MTYLVRRIAAGEWQELRAIRLAALRDTPTAFSSSYAEVATHSDTLWREQAATEATSDTSATFVASDEHHAWAGMASVAPLVEVPDHAHIHAVYVCAAHRGPTGPGSRLMEMAIRFAQEHIDATHLTLGVHESNARALAFYRRIGFDLTGKVIPYRPAPTEKCHIWPTTPSNHGDPAGHEAVARSLRTVARATLSPGGGDLRLWAHESHRHQRIRPHRAQHAACPPRTGQRPGGRRRQ